MVNTSLNVGILALQGAFDLHRQPLEKVQKINIVEVRTPKDLDSIDGIILPGGESTVLTKLLDSSGVGQELKKLIDDGLPNFGTCAGLILQANYFQCIDCEIERNAYGNQNDSFQTQVDFQGNTVDAFFIRAPKISSSGTADIVSTLHGEPVGLMSGNSLGITFHPEVAGDTTIHSFFVSLINERVKSNVDPK